MLPLACGKELAMYQKQQLVLSNCSDPILALLPLHLQSICASTHLTANTHACMRTGLATRRCLIGAFFPAPQSHHDELGHQAQALC